MKKNKETQTKTALTIRCTLVCAGFIAATTRRCVLPVWLAVLALAMGMSYCAVTVSVCCCADNLLKRRQAKINDKELAKKEEKMTAWANLI